MHNDGAKNQMYGEWLLRKQAKWQTMSRISSDISCIQYSQMTRSRRKTYGGSGDSICNPFFIQVAFSFILHMSQAESSGLAMFQSASHHRAVYACSTKINVRRYTNPLGSLVRRPAYPVWDHPIEGGPSPRVWILIYKVLAKISVGWVARTDPLGLRSDPHHRWSLTPLSWRFEKLCRRLWLK